VAFAGLTGTLSIVTLFALISSFFIAYYYDNSIQHEELSISLPEALLELTEKVPIDSEEAYQFTLNEKEVVLINYLETVLENTIEVLATVETSADTIASNVITLEDSLLIAENIDVVAEPIPMVKKFLYPMKYQEPKDYFEISATNIITLQTEVPLSLEIAMKIDEEVEVFNNLMNFKEPKNILNTPLFLNAIDAHLNQPISPVVSLEPNQLSIVDTMQAPCPIEDAQPASDDLDDLMDFAFLQKEQRNFWQALKAFRQILSLYPSTEVAPFLIMEIATILKNMGSYDEAITVLTEGRLLATVMSNSMLEHEFVNNIAFLRVVKNILVKNSLNFIPFNRIPESTFQEINNEFCEWRNQS
jgi:tetratricopeptide (TPR) repeat protein